MKSSRMAAQLRTLAARPSMESADEVASNVAQPQLTQAEGVPNEDAPGTGKVVASVGTPQDEAVEVSAEPVTGLGAEEGTVSQESVGWGIFGGFLASPIALGVMGAKIENRIDELKDLEKQIAAAEADLAKAEKARLDAMQTNLKAAAKAKTTVSQEGVLGAVAGAATGIATSVAGPAAPIVGAIIGGFSGKKLEELNEEVAESRKKLERLQREANHARDEIFAAVQRKTTVSTESFDDEAAEGVVVAPAAEVAPVAEAEAEAVVADPEDVAHAEAEAASDATEAELIEAIDEQEDHIEEYEEAEATLESIMSALRDARVDGGLTPQGARFMQIGFESVTQRLAGVSPVLPSMESLGGVQSRIRGAEVSMESVGDWLKNIWEAMKKAWNAMISYASKFLAAVFDRGERYKQRAAKLISAARGLSADKVYLGESYSGLSKKVNIKGDFSPKSMTVLVDLAGKASELVEDGVQVREGYLRAAKSALAGGGLDEMTKAAEAFKKYGPTAFLPSSFKKTGTGNTGHDIYETDVLPGNVKLTFKHARDQVNNDVGEDAPAFLRALDTFANKVADSVGYTLMVEPVEVYSKEAPVAYTPSEIQEVAKYTISMVNKGEEARKALGDLSKPLDGVQIKDDAPMMAKLEFKAVTSYARSLLKTLTSTATTQIKFAVSSAGAYLDYAEASVKARAKASNKEAKPEAGEAVAA